MSSGTCIRSPCTASAHEFTATGSTVGEIQSSALRIRTFLERSWRHGAPAPARHASHGGARSGAPRRLDLHSPPLAWHDASSKPACCICGRHGDRIGGYGGSSQPAWGATGKRTCFVRWRGPRGRASDQSQAGHGTLGVHGRALPASGRPGRVLHRRAGPVLLRRE